ncbi:O-antigen ligase family protein [Echinicola rosea]|nr:O-antigen ligase family protein [Echinicola rosea]
MGSVIKYLSLVTMLGILLVLSVTHSRAAWLAVIVSSVFLFSFCYEWYAKVRAWLGKGLKRVLFLFVLGVVCVGVLTGLYFLKKDSADGRLLIWKVSGQLIKEQPLFGIGFDRFRAGYMEAQAAYFRQNPGDPSIPLADDVVYAFNEGIQLLVEQGMVGFVLVLALLFVSFRIKGSREKPEIWIAKTGLISLLVFGMFSYPSHILPIKLCGVVYLAILAGYSKTLCTIPEFSKRIKWGVSGAFMVLTIGLILHTYRFYQASKEWQDALISYEKGEYRASLGQYEKAWAIFAHDGAFLCNYGKALSVAGDHTKAVTILKEAENYLNNTIIQTALGDSYQALGRYAKAEAAYQLGADMLPDRFYSKYLLVKLYHKMGEERKMSVLATYLLEKEPKVPSQAVEEIKQEMRLLLD